MPRNKKTMSCCKDIRNRQADTEAEAQRNYRRRKRYERKKKTTTRMRKEETAAVSHTPTHTLRV